MSVAPAVAADPGVLLSLAGLLKAHLSPTDAEAMYAAVYDSCVVDAVVLNRGVARAAKYLEDCVAISDSVSDVGSPDETDPSIRDAERSLFLGIWYRELWDKVLRALKVYFRVAPAVCHRDRDKVFRVVSSLNDVNAGYLEVALNALDMASDAEERQMWQDLGILPKP